MRVGDIEPPDGERMIGNIRIVGNDEVSDGDIIERLQSQVQSIAVDADDALVDRSEIAIDARRIESIYAAFGYFRARVVDFWVTESGHRMSTVTFQVEEGPPTLVTTIEFDGLRFGEGDIEADVRLTEVMNRVRRLVPLREGDVWTEEDYQAGLDQLTQALVDTGFVHARVTGDNLVSRERNEVGVFYQVDHGPLVRVSYVDVTGLRHVKRSDVIDRVAIKPGDIIVPSKLRATEDHVHDLGKFYGVQARVPRDASLGTSKAGPTRRSVATPKPGADDETDAPLPAELPVIVRVQEVPRWDVSFGVGFATNAASSDNLRIDLNTPIRLTYHHLFGSLVAIRSNVTPALVLPDLTEGVEPRFGFKGDLIFEWPSFIEEFLKLSVEGSYDRDASQDTITEEFGASIGFSRRFFDILNTRIGYNISSFQFFTGSVTGLTTDQVRDQAADLSRFRFVDQDLITFIDVALAVDLRDGVYDARKGFYAALSANIASTALGGDVDYLRLQADVRGYVRAARWLTLATRARVGWNFFPKNQGTPGPARFRAGGPSSMRGFTTGRMGDYICAEAAANAAGETLAVNGPCPTDATDRTYIGGNFLLETNTEARFYLSDTIGMTAFVDVAQLWSRSTDITASSLDVAVGPGFFYLTPIGPIRVDLGFLVASDRISSELGFEFVFNLSLGQAF